MSSTIGDLGEFGVIARVSARFPRTGDVILGAGDDAAILATPDQRVVATTDVLAEGWHFRREWSSAEDVGHKAVAQNVADIAAMGARPTALLIALAAPSDLSVAWIDAFTTGVAAECSTAGGTVAGGDIATSSTLTIAVTAHGDLGGGRAVRRDGARPGDIVAVTGNLGLSAAGLALLCAGLDGPLACLEEHRRPRPPYGEGPRAATLGASAMVDVSDGLAQDLGHIARASGVAIDVDGSALTPRPELREAVELLGESRRDPRRAADLMLAGGEDHALAATFPPGVALPETWTGIGTVSDGSGVTVDGGVPPGGAWQHLV